MVREGGGAGRRKAQYNLGVMYDNGQGVDVNYKKAIERVVSLSGCMNILARAWTAMRCTKAAAQGFLQPTPEEHGGHGGGGDYGVKVRLDSRRGHRGNSRHV